MKPDRATGYTLVEVAVAVAIISTAVVAIPLMGQWFNRQAVRHAVEQLQADLQLSRVWSIRRRQTCVVRFNNPGLNQYVLGSENRCCDLARYRGDVHFLKRGPDGKPMASQVSFNCQGMSATVVPAYIFITGGSGTTIYRVRVKLPGGISVHRWCGDHWQ